MLLTIGLCISQAFITVRVAFIPGKVFQALSVKDYGTAATQIVWGSIVYLICAFSGAVARFFGKVYVFLLSHPLTLVTSYSAVSLYDS